MKIKNKKKSKSKNMRERVLLFVMERYRWELNHGSKYGYDHLDLIPLINAILSNSDIIVQLSLLDESKYSIIREKQNLIGILNPYSNKEKIKKFNKKKINLFFFKLFFLLKFFFIF